MGQPIERLKTRADFLRVAGARRKWVTPGMIVQTAKRPAPRSDRPVDKAKDGSPQHRTQGALAPRLGLTASRKVGGAVERNRARRRLRALANALLPRLGERGQDYVLIARAATVTRDYAALTRDLESALEGLRRGAAKEKRAGSS